MRAWGLAKGLLTNGIDVAVGVNNSFPQAIKEHEGVRLLNWGLDENFADLINTYDAVVMSYCMGDPSVFVVDHINEDVQLILDVYVPIYVEVSARESKDIDTEYSAYMADIVRFNKVLGRGDYFLCANDAQKTFYTGVLSSLGIINPRSYREERIQVLPFGIHNEAMRSNTNPYAEIGINPSDFIVLWFGGLYPWFRVEEYLDAIKHLAKNKSIKFVFVGGKNPFNPNPDFFRQYDKAVEFAAKNKLLETAMFFVDWVDFDKRASWYKSANIVISLNQPGEENRYSWRTRVMDYVWGELAILTNGGDPLSEDLIAANAALRLPELSSKAIVDSLQDVFIHRDKLASVKKQVKNIKPNYYWPVITKSLALLIKSGSLPNSSEITYRKNLGLENKKIAPSSTESSGKVRKVIDSFPQVISKVRKKGIAPSAKLAYGLARTQVKNLQTKRAKQYVFISHPINNTGAPLVLLQIVEEFADKYGGSNVRLLAPGIETEQLRKMRELGVRVDKAVFGVGFRFIRMQLALNKNDFVLMNTVAIYDNYRDFIMLWLKNGRLHHAYWFIHEDIAQLPNIHKEFLDKRNLNQVRDLTDAKKLTLLTPSNRTKLEYNELLETDKVKSVSLHVDVDKKFKISRHTADYKTINFLLSGTPSDGRKGQFLALSAFYSFLTNHYIKDPASYRNFKLHLVAIGDDYISRQIRWTGDSLLREHVVYYPTLSKDKHLSVSLKCNAVICCSLNETFGLYVAEGMFMGHVVLRNNSAGIDEQLEEGVNGFFIDHTDIKQFASVIEKILNKKLSDEELQAMGKASQEIIRNYSDNSYLNQIENLQ